MSKWSAFISSVVLYNVASHSNIDTYIHTLMVAADMQGAYNKITCSFSHIIT